MALAAVALGLWGVLTDVGRMAIRKYGRTPEVLASRYGGPVEAWRKPQMSAIEWLAAHAEKGASRRPGAYRQVIGEGNREFILRMFKGAGVAPPADPEAAGRALEFEVMSGVDAGYADAHHAIAALRGAGHRVIVAAEDSEEAARGALTGARFADGVDDVFTEDGLDAEAKGAEYWRRLAPRLAMPAAQAFVVHATPESLEAAASAGFRCILVDRDREVRRVPRCAETTLRSLADLPACIERAVKAGPVRA